MPARLIIILRNVLALKLHALLEINPLPQPSLQQYPDRGYTDFPRPRGKNRAFTRSRNGGGNSCCHLGGACSFSPPSLSHPPADPRTETAGS